MSHRHDRLRKQRLKTQLDCWHGAPRNSGDVTLESPLGRTALRPGTAYWLPGLTPHDTRNESRSPARFYEIFLKRCD